MEQTFSIFDVEDLPETDFNNFLQDPFVSEREYRFEVAERLDELELLRSCPLNNPDQEIRDAWDDYYIDTDIETVPGKRLLDVYHRLFSLVIYHKETYRKYIADYRMDEDYINQVSSLSTEDIIIFIKSNVKDGVMALAAFFNTYVDRLYSSIVTGSNEPVFEFKHNRRANVDRIIIQNTVDVLIYRRALDDNNMQLIRMMQILMPKKIKMQIINSNYVHISPSKTVKDYAESMVRMIESVIGYNLFLLEIPRKI